MGVRAGAGPGAVGAARHGPQAPAAGAAARLQPGGRPGRLRVRPARLRRHPRRAPAAALPLPRHRCARRAGAGGREQTLGPVPRRPLTPKPTFLRTRRRLSGGRGPAVLGGGPRAGAAEGPLRGRERRAGGAGGLPRGPRSTRGSGAPGPPVPGRAAAVLQMSFVNQVLSAS